MENTIQATKAHCKYCFEVLIAKLTNQAPPAWPVQLNNISVPLFVTWTYTKNEELRGCIGTFAQQKLQAVLPQYTLISALQDDRFQPISLDEIEHLTVAVSLLVNFQKNKKAYDWVVGKHGIQIDFKDKNRHYSGTFLPEVAKQQKWSQEETLKHLIRKAGYRGNYKDVIDSINLTTYESSKADLSYDDYKLMINKP